jgi:hypothetical protein
LLRLGSVGFGLFNSGLFDSDLPDLVTTDFVLLGLGLESGLRTGFLGLVDVARFFAFRPRSAIFRPPGNL